jgi:predicted deacylase
VLGGDRTRRTVLIVSGTHGVEGFAGSALQRRWLDQRASTMPDDVRVVLVHALNPYGFAWTRRVDERNVDLNRNSLDWSRPPPDNPGYDEIADLLVPPRWDPATRQRTTAALLEHATRVGLDRMQAVVSGGQYAHPTGVFYGGAEPSWSTDWLRAWAPTALADVDELVVIDLHTGLGPFGHGELIGHAATSSSAHRDAVALWGDVRSMVDGQSVSARLSGDWLGTIDELAPTSRTAAVALEFGTVDTVTVLQALRADAWLHAHGDPIDTTGDAIREQVRAAFCSEDPAWIEQAWIRFADVADAAMLPFRDTAPS